MIRNYYYNGQLKKAIKMFANIFTGMIVKTGQNACGEIDDIGVPIRYGSTDRVASAIAAANTQNKLHTLPMMSCYMTGIELAPDRMHGVNMVDRRTYLEQGGVYPDDVKAIRRVMPIPYNLQMELAIYASNTEQAYQVLEQLMLLFDYQLQIQLNDAPFDWSKITSVELTGIGNEEVYPVGTERRVLVWTMTFNYPIWISPPYDVRADIINSITINIGNIDDFTLEEVDGEGNLVPFDPLISPAVIEGPTTANDPPPAEPPPYEPQHFDPTTEPCNNDISTPSINLTHEQ